MASALIGYTGFVGGNLCEQMHFDELYNSKNIKDIQGKEFDLVICAGVKAVKYYANQHPEEDRSDIDSLLSMLRTIKTKKLVLISTIDVYPHTVGYDESFNCTDLPNHAYGINRLYFENTVSNLFDTHIIRLPGLFGKGIKKNVIYDLLNDNLLQNIDPGACIQYYPLEYISKDIGEVIHRDIRLINFFPFPLYTYEIIDLFFPDKKSSIISQPSNRIKYDLHTKYGHFFGGDEFYMYSHEKIIEALGRFISGYSLIHE